jgi:hypothetical protein
MRFSYSAVWDDAAAMVRAHGSLIAALAGVFLFLPSLLVAQLLPKPTVTDPSRAIEAMREFYTANLLWLLLGSLVSMVGTIAILKLLLGPRGTSVGGAIAAAFFPLLPVYFLVSLISNLIFGVGLLLLVVPGLYLFGRLAPLGPVVVAEKRYNPIDSIGRAWALTKGRGWAVLGFLLLVGVAGAVSVLVVDGVAGVLFVLVAGKGLGGFLSGIVNAAAGAAFSAFFAVIFAALYRRLAGGEAGAELGAVFD